MDENTYSHVQDCTSFQNDMYNSEETFVILANFPRARIARN